MGWAQLLPAIIGLLGGSLFSGSKDGTAPVTADQAEMNSLMKQLLKGQFEDYNSGAPLRSHIQSVADWLLPKRSRITFGPGDGENIATRPGTSQGGTGTDTPKGPIQPKDPPPTLGDPPPDTRFTPAGAFGGGDPTDRTSALSMTPPTSVDPMTMQNLAQYLAKYKG